MTVCGSSVSTIVRLQAHGLRRSCSLYTPAEDTALTHSKNEVDLGRQTPVEVDRRLFALCIFIETELNSRFVIHTSPKGCMKKQ